MKNILFIIFLFGSSKNCVSQFYFDSILYVQNQAAINTPYKSVYKSPGKIDKKLQSYIQTQINFRKTNYPKEIIKILSGKEQLKDTLWIVEIFNDECWNCESIAYRILYKDTLWFYKRVPWDERIEFGKFSYKEQSKSNKSDWRLLEISEAKQRIAENMEWDSDPLKYGIEGGHDGTHTFLTLIFPSKNVSSIYVRMWVSWQGKKVVGTAKNRLSIALR